MIVEKDEEDVDEHDDDDDDDDDDVVLYILTIFDNVATSWSNQSGQSKSPQKRKRWRGNGVTKIMICYGVAAFFQSDVITYHNSLLIIEITLML